MSFALHSQNQAEVNHFSFLPAYFAHPEQGHYTYPKGAVPNQNYTLIQTDCQGGHQLSIHPYRVSFLPLSFCRQR